MVWDGYVKPFNIFGNLYFIGTEPASTHLIDTGDGLILLDTGYQHSMYLVLNNIWELGFSPYDIKYLIHTHGHIDHFGATRAFVELTGAKTFIGRPDEDYANGKLDLSYAKELGMEFKEAFEPDVLIDDGDVIQLGNTEIKCVATPGHTPGAMSYFFNVTDGTETYRAGLHGGMGINTLSSEFLNQYALPFSLRDDFRNSMLRLNQEKVDIFLGNHMQHNHTLAKANMLKDGNPHAFINPNEWQDYNLWCIENLENMVKREKNAV